MYSYRWIWPGWVTYIRQWDALSTVVLSLHLCFFMQYPRGVCVFVWVWPKYFIWLSSFTNKLHTNTNKTAPNMVLTKKNSTKRFFSICTVNGTGNEFRKVCGKVSLVYIKPLIFVHIFVNLQNVGFFRFVFFLSLLSKNIHVFFCAQGNSIQWWKKKVQIPVTKEQTNIQHKLCRIIYLFDIFRCGICFFSLSSRVFKYLCMFCWYHGYFYHRFENRIQWISFYSNNNQL